VNMVIPNEGKTLMLDQIFRLTTTRETFVLDLFQSNTTVGDASTAADFTIASFTGYAQVAIARGDWTAATVVSNEGNITKTTAPTFTCSGGSPQTVYGWILRGATSGIIYAGQNFATARVMSTGATESIDPMTIKDKTFV
jgi:hypothetical protein